MLNSTQLADAARSQELPRQLQAIAQNLNIAVGEDGAIQTVATTVSETIGTPKSGTATITGQSLPSGASASAETCRSVTITNTEATATLLWGNVTVQLMLLAAGASVSLPCTNTEQIYVKVDGGTATYVYIPVIAAI